MKRILMISILLIMLFSTMGFTQLPASMGYVGSTGPRTYTVLVGADNVKMGVSLMAFFPNKLSIHVGDTVVFKANSHEIHTVTFLAENPMPDFTIFVPNWNPSVSPTPIQVNPQAFLPSVPANNLYDGSTYVNSGVMSTDPNSITTFSLTFTQAGTYEFVCLVHGMMMSGQIQVVDPSTRVASPLVMKRRGNAQMSALWAHVPAAIKDATKAVQTPTDNGDGTTTYHVMVGYSEGQIMLMRFFPNNLTVKQGDSIIYSLPSNGDAPHTVTFLNGNPDPELFVAVPQPNQPPLLYIGPGVFFPSNLDKPLNNTDFFNSGLLAPGSPNTSVTYTVGNVSGTLEYECLLHDTSGMVGTLYVK